MISRLILAVLATFWLVGCGEESQSDRSGEQELVNNPTDESKDAKKETNSKSTSEEDAEKLAKQLEEQGLTNGGSPLLAINLSQGAAIIPAGAQTFWLATGIYEDESERDLTDLAEWGTTNTAIIEAMTDDPGGVRAIAAGTANVTAKVGGISTSTSMTVIP